LARKKAGFEYTNHIYNEPTTSYKLEAEQAIEKTLIFAENNNIWKNKRERLNNNCILKRIAKNTDIFNQEKVKAWILTLKKENGQDTADTTKCKMEMIYRKFSEANNMPKYRYKQPYKKSPIPIIQTTEEVEAVINGLPLKWYVPFMIMSNFEIEAEELHTTPQSQINIQTGTISIVGTKRHNNGVYILNEEQRETLIKYLATHTKEYPFPSPRTLSSVWRRNRNRVAKTLNKPDLKKIPMKNLRNYAGAIFYTTYGKDPIATKEFMRHKRLEQTMSYLRGIKTFTTKAKRIGKLVTTAEEALELTLQGFTEEAVYGQGTPNEKHVLTKLNI
jgi:hypothetical protein